MKTACIVILIIAAVLLAVIFLACGYIFNQVVWRKTLSLPKFIEKLVAGNDEEYDVYGAEGDKARQAFLDRAEVEEIDITAPDGARLKGRVVVPQSSNGRLVLACHGARSSGLGEFCFMLHYLYDNGYTVVMPDHRGCGDSDGKFLGYGTHESRDTFLWLDYARKRFPDLEIFLLGVSMGAATVLMMSDKVTDSAVKGIIADCPYSSAWDEFSYQIKTSFHLPEFPILHICSLYCRIFAGYWFSEASPLNAVKNAKRPILFIHGNADDFVPTFMTDKLYDACPTEKYKLIVDGAVHARSYYQDSKSYQRAIAEFMDRYSKV